MPLELLKYSNNILNKIKKLYAPHLISVLAYQ